MFYGDTWGGVPAGSRLEVALRTSHGVGVDGTHVVTRPGGGVLQGSFSSAEFPLSVGIGRGEQHNVKFDVFFAGTPADVEVVGRVVQPDGSLFGEESPAQARLTTKAKIFTVKFFVVGEP